MEQNRRDLSQTPENTHFTEVLRQEVADDITRIADTLLDSAETTHADGLLLDLAGYEVDDPSDARAVGSVSHRVVEVSGVPTGIRVANFREEPTGLRILDTIIKTEVVFSEPLTKSATKQLPVRISVLQTQNAVGDKQTLGVAAHYMRRETGEAEAIQMPVAEESRILKSATAALQKSL